MQLCFNLLYLHIIIKKKINTTPPPLLQKKNINNNWINTFSFLYEIDVF